MPIKRKRKSKATLDTKLELSTSGHNCFMLAPNLVDNFALRLTVGKGTFLRLQKHGGSLIIVLEKSKSKVFIETAQYNPVLF